MKKESETNQNEERKLRKKKQKLLDEQASTQPNVFSKMVQSSDKKSSLKMTCLPSWRCPAVLGQVAGPVTASTLLKTVYKTSFGSEWKAFEAGLNTTVPSTIITSYASRL
jgi:hypothetical protein